MREERAIRKRWNVLELRQGTEGRIRGLPEHQWLCRLGSWVGCVGKSTVTTLVLCQTLTRNSFGKVNPSPISNVRASPSRPLSFIRPSLLQSSPLCLQRHTTPPTTQKKEKVKKKTSHKIKHLYSRVNWGGQFKGHVPGH